MDYATDLSGFGRNLVITGGAGAATFSGDRIRGASSLWLNGSTAYARPAQTFDIGSTVTLAGWVKIPSHVPSKVETILSNRTSATGNGFSLYVTGPSASAVRIVLATRNGGAADTLVQTPAGTFPYGTWTHIAVRTRPGTNQTVIYRNGVSVASGTAVAGFNTTQQITVGGSSSSSAAPTLGGFLDDVRIYSSYATPEQISALHSPNSAPLSINSPP
jgi:hypothetical protein